MSGSTPLTALKPLPTPWRSMLWAALASRIPFFDGCIASAGGMYVILPASLKVGPPKLEDTFLRVAGFATPWIPTTGENPALGTGTKVVVGLIVAPATTGSEAV